MKPDVGLVGVLSAPQQVKGLIQKWLISAGIQTVAWTRFQVLSFFEI